MDCMQLPRRPRDLTDVLEPRRSNSPRSFRHRISQTFPSVYAARVAEENTETPRLHALG